MSDLRSPCSAADHDVRLMELVRSGDERAFAVLFARYEEAVRRLATSIVVVDADAEEVTIDVFVQAWHRAETFDPLRGTVPAWLLAMARSQALSGVRRHRRRARALASAPYGHGGAFQPARLGESPHEVDCRRTVIPLLERLPLPQREVIQRAYLEGFTQSEIADELDAPLGTVKSRMRIGMDKLRSWATERATA